MYIKFFKTKIKFSEYFRSNIEKIILERLKETDKFYLVVPGGSTIKVILKLLNSIAIDWSKIYLIFSDERCVPIYNDLRNDLIIDKHLREYNFLKKLNFIRIPAELGPKEGTNKFKKILDRIPDFDLCILGFGEDGHTASLFPNHSALKNKSSAVAITNSPKFPPNRISIGLVKLNSSRYKIAIAYRKGKDKVIDLIKKKENLPITLVSSNYWIFED